MNAMTEEDEVGWDKKNPTYLTHVLSHQRTDKIQKLKEFFFVEIPGNLRKIDSIPRKEHDLSV